MSSTDLPLSRTDVFRIAREGGDITGIRVREQAGKQQDGTIARSDLQRTRSGMLRVAVRFDVGDVRWINAFRVL